MTVSTKRPYTRWGIRVCPHCKVSFKPCRKAQVWCSRQCAGLDRRGPKSPFWKGGTMRPDGYLVVCIGQRHILLHRHIMEQHLDRPLDPREVVHHLDGNPLNNDLSNLSLLPSKGAHRSGHSKVFRSETHKECTLCHVVKPRAEFRQKPAYVKDPHSSRCKECTNAEQNRRRHSGDWKYG